MNGRFERQVHPPDPHLNRAWTLEQTAKISILQNLYDPVFDKPQDRLLSTSRCQFPTDMTRLQAPSHGDLGAGDLLTLDQHPETEERFLRWIHRSLSSDNTFIGHDPLFYYDTFLDHSPITFLNTLDGRDSLKPFNMLTLDDPAEVSGLYDEMVLKRRSGTFPSHDPITFFKTF
jgi:hypothetical protein